MEEIIINRNSKWQYIFSADSIVVKKKRKIIHFIKISDIEEITYTPKFTIRNMLLLLMCPVNGYSLFPQAFVILCKKGKPEIVSLKISNSDFKRIKPNLENLITIV